MDHFIKPSTAELHPGPSHLEDNSNPSVSFFKYRLNNWVANMSEMEIRDKVKKVQING